MGEVHAITSAARSHSEQADQRIVRYLWTMLFRTICFIVAAFMHNVWSIPILIAATLLPWFAVIMANSGGERREVPTTYVDVREIGPGSND